MNPHEDMDEQPKEIQRTAIEALAYENECLTRRIKEAGIADLAADNPNLGDYMQHWETRTQKAEAMEQVLSVDNCRLRAELADALAKKKIAEDLAMELARDKGRLDAELGMAKSTPPSS
jgi:hypothetical protein